MNKTEFPKVQELLERIENGIPEIYNLLATRYWRYVTNPGSNMDSNSEVFISDHRPI